MAVQAVGMQELVELRERLRQPCTVMLRRWREPGRLLLLPPGLQSAELRLGPPRTGWFGVIRHPAVPNTIISTLPASIGQRQTRAYSLRFSDAPCGNTWFS